MAGTVLDGMKCAIFIRRLTAPEITKCPWEHGSSMVKPTEIVDQRYKGVGRGDLGVLVVGS